MPKVFHPLLPILANATHRQLAAQVQYLKVKNEILWSKLSKRITVMAAEQARLIRFGEQMGGASRDLITMCRGGGLSGAPVGRLR